MEEPDAIEALATLARRHDDTADLSKVFEEQLARAAIPHDEMQRVLGALRCATARCTEHLEAELLCGFCGKSQADVGAIVVAAENAICDECILASVEVIQRNQKSKVIYLALEAVRVATSLVTRHSRKGT